MNGWRSFAAAAIVACTAIVGGAGSAPAQTKPQGEMRFALYVTVPPAWLDPGEAAPGFTSPFWVLYALHDALVKPMPGQRMAPSLAESWTESPDKLSYEFKLRKGVKFHNGDPFTADDVVFSFARAKGAELHQKVKEVVAVDPYTVRFVLPEPWPDFMTFYGTLASAASWITPKKYFEQGRRIAVVPLADIENKTFGGPMLLRRGRDDPLVFGVIVSVRMNRSAQPLPSGARMK